MDEENKFSKCSNLEWKTEKDFVKQLVNEYGNDFDRDYNSKDIEKSFIKLLYKVNMERTKNL